MKKPTYTNPILPGDYPDPAVIRVGGDYYSTHSTFQYFPALPILHSRDLVHWRTIGHALNRLEQLDLSRQLDSAGVWAPDIEYHNGLFHVVYPVFDERVDGSPLQLHIFLVSSDRPEGPYSDPVRLLSNVEREGCFIDPGLFFDDDGRVYLLWAGSFMIELSSDLKSTVGEGRQLWTGTGRDYSGEGPHLFKHNGWYYLTMAEGGTFYGHCQSLARSRSVWGPYESCPDNPIVFAESADAPVQKCGHGKFVQTVAGDWYLMLLGGRPLHGEYCVLGRESFLVPLEETDDGWFRAEGGASPKLQYPLPRIATEERPEAAGDAVVNEFNRDSLALEWQWVRGADAAAWSLNERPGWLRLHARPRRIDAADADTVLLRRIQHFDFHAEVVMQVHGCRGNLLLYLDGKHHLRLEVDGTDAGKPSLLRLLKCCDGIEECLAEQACHGATAEELTLGFSSASFQLQAWWGDGDEARQAFGPEVDGSFLSCDWVRKQGDARCFTGTMIGFAATGETGTMDVGRFEVWDKVRD